MITLNLAVRYEGITLWIRSDRGGIAREVQVDH